MASKTTGTLLHNPSCKTIEVLRHLDTSHVYARGWELASLNPVESNFSNQYYYYVLYRDAAVLCIVYCVTLFYSKERKVCARLFFLPQK